VIAKNATNATNATMLGGVPSGGYLRVGAALPSGATETGAWGFGSDNASVPY
jgi:hypothetical protein